MSVKKKHISKMASKLEDKRHESCKNINSSNFRTRLAAISAQSSNNNSMVIKRGKNNRIQCEQQEQQVSENKRMEQTEPSNVHVLILFSLFVLFVLFYTGLRLYLRPTKGSIPVPVNPISEYQNEIQQIKYMYWTQTDDFWNILKASAQHVLTDKELKSPAVIMLVIPAGAKPMTLCLAGHWSQIINRLLGGQSSDVISEPVVDGSSLAAYKPSKQKLVINQQIKHLVESGHKSIIISGLEDLHSEAVQLLHGFCNSTKAVYKKVTLTFMLEVPAEEHHIISDIEVHSHLSEIWSDLESDQIKNLQVGLASNIAFLTPDDNFMGC